jgi:hydrogenase maturation protein HypF
MKRIKLIIKGQVQGVGFRPALYRYAKKNNFSGWVVNTSDSVVLEIEGSKEKIDGFVSMLPNPDSWAEYPIQKLQIESISQEQLDLLNDKGFFIKPSTYTEEVFSTIPSDLSICSDCHRELFDSLNKRYLYPFITCTNCGPRFSIIKKVPYDRVNTTMKKFGLCDDCGKEYADPADRRFHAEPVSCYQCGPSLELVRLETGSIKQVEKGNKNTIRKTADLLAEGKIVAVKGIGGFHLACDAVNNEAVDLLRKRKFREDKPFAVMARDLDTIKKYCEVSPEEEKLLTSYKRPVVLLKRALHSGGTQSADKTVPRISGHVAPGNKYLGFMLPYTALHYLLFSEQACGTSGTKLNTLVFTSGNVSDEPIAYYNEEALTRLENVADYFLLHDRDIHMRCDDSVTRVIAGRESVIRRSRGYVPDPIKLPAKIVKPILACGAELKNTFCLAVNNYAYISHYIGDLENVETLYSYDHGIEHFKKFFSITPEIIAYDLHPEYMSTKYALKVTESGSKAVTIGVQHHHAHVVSCMVDNNLSGTEKVIGVAFDGLGFGSDETLWGAEFMVADFRNYTRAANMKYAYMPGGQACIREPWRMGCSYLYDVYGEDFFNIGIPFTRKINKHSWETMLNMIKKKVNSPKISSMGRLFDGVSAVLNLRDSVNYEGQSAVELEQIIDDTFCQARGYEFTFDRDVTGTKGKYVIDFAPVIKQIVNDIKNNVAQPVISAKFHFAIVTLIENLCKKINEETGIKKVVLTGGVFQNVFLVEHARDRLTKSGFDVYSHSRIPTNDGGICLGQAVIANEQSCV